MNAWPAGHERVMLDEVDSTMAEAARRVSAGVGVPTWICARVQTAGRGRRGRAWVHPAGNFAATLIMRCDETPERRALRSFVAALALFDALGSVTGRVDGLTLKWPNDVLLNGGKVAGILLEGLGAHLAIGIGVNLQSAPDVGELEAGAVRPVSLLSETGASVPCETFLAALATAYAAREQSFVTYGFAPIREAWLTRAARLGEVVTARMGERELRGTFETVDDQGRIVLVTPRGRDAIAAADIFF